MYELYVQNFLMKNNTIKWGYQIFFAIHYSKIVQSHCCNDMRISIWQ